MEKIILFFNCPFFTIIGGAFSLLSIAGFLYTLFIMFKGIMPIWYRLGLGLSNRKIAIFATDKHDELKSIICASKLFKAKNITQIAAGDMEEARNNSVFLVAWKDFEEKIDEILSLKKSHAALIVYAPQEEGKINDETLKKINYQRNAVIVNFRGRLINDLLLSMMTTTHDE